MSKITGLAEAGGKVNQFSTLGLAFNFHFDFSQNERTKKV